MRRVLLLVLIAVTLPSCGGDEPRPDAVAPTPPAPERGAGGLALSVGHPSPLRSGADVAWTLTVRNDGPAVTLEFASGQDGDVVLHQGGQERYRWSEGRAFTQAFRQVALAPGEVRSFELDAGPLRVPPGSYRLVASLRARPAPPATEETVTVV